MKPDTTSAAHDIMANITTLTPTVAVMDTAIKHPVPDHIKPSFVIFDILLMLKAERQSARMSKITNDRLKPIWKMVLYISIPMAIGNSGRQRVKPVCKD